MKQTIIYQPEEQKNKRIDKFIAESFPEYSRSALTKLFELNLIKLNGEPIQPGFRLKPGAQVEYDLGPLQAKPEVIELPIIYEDNDVIVINKPAGIISHARGKFWQEASVASFIRDKISTELEGERGGIVHRLDRVTSGVMICAKNENTLKELQKAFSDRKVEKSYVALVRKRPKDNEFIVEAPIQRDPKVPKRFRVHKDGKPSTTRVKVLSSDEHRTLLLLTPTTGRTHQLRVHLQYIHNPIIGDPLYADDSDKYSEHSNSLRLHALKLVVPISSKERVFMAPIPDYWELDNEELSSLEALHG